MDKLPPSPIVSDIPATNRKLDLAGIATSYINAKGQHEVIHPDIRERLFSAMAASETQVDHSVISPVKVFCYGSEYQLILNQPGEYQWHLQLEDLSLVALPYEQPYHGETQSTDIAITLPSSLPLGYHQLILNSPTGNWQCKVIITPERCFEPSSLLNGERLWGSCIQLYSLRSETNWGIGDFSDLKHALREIAQRGGAFIGLNPIHALYPANPQSASPYSPSSRNWLNIIYIDVMAVPEFQQNEAAQHWLHNEPIQQRLREARETVLVDYPQVMALKLEGLDLAYQQFKLLDERHERVQAFAYFQQNCAQALQQQAEFDALHGWLTAENKQMWGWPAWPVEYHDAANPAVRQFVQRHPDEVRFYAWLQWLAHTQLGECFALSQRQGMAIGLYRDLAVGVAEGGSDTWCDKTLYRMKASIGAPPDPLGPLGQNWGLPPMDPLILQQRAYQPFIDLLRDNMTHCGALRIDHVMSLLRLWWIPYGETADMGGYVTYPVDDLLAILALESQRQKCMVIGEDLGIVPPEIVHKLQQYGVYSYKVLYFEQAGINHFKLPQDYPAQSMATITTHDLPTLRSYWHAGDLELGESLGLYPDKATYNALRLSREENKRALIATLIECGLLTEKPQDMSMMTAELSYAIHQFIALSASLLVGLQPEDWLGIVMPVNVPGTTDQYPNWRRKLSCELQEMFEHPEVNELLKAVHSGREIA
ncbi:4-alpha-glucanotransferase [Pragia fontium]|uniref:4-alpha-glucanotransferase n=1 Tax=Pragia fontium TaxID=82985 RepID=UPI000F6D6735|nr:4-alpha-glucanotransferase [Pragia fontium]VEJ54922.1 4-alpha-glucanotransferase [Pragia fontium]